jgi:hypothetical protein
VISLPYYFTTNSTTTFNINLLNTLLLFLNGYLIRRERKRERERKTTSQMNEILISKEARDEKARVSTVSYLTCLRRGLGVCGFKAYKLESVSFWRLA